MHATLAYSKVHASSIVQPNQPITDNSEQSQAVFRSYGVQADAEVGNPRPVSKSGFKPQTALCDLSKYYLSKATMRIQCRFDRFDSRCDGFHVHIRRETDSWPIRHDRVAKGLLNSVVIFSRRYCRDK